MLATGPVSGFPKPERYAANLRSVCARLGSQVREAQRVDKKYEEANEYFRSLDENERSRFWEIERSVEDQMKIEGKYYKSDIALSVAFGFGVLFLSQILAFLYGLNFDTNRISLPALGLSLIVGIFVFFYVRSKNAHHHSERWYRSMLLHRGEKQKH